MLAVKKFVLIVISASLFAGCNSGDLDFDDVKVQPITGVFAFPLGDATYVMRDIIENQTGDSLNLQEDSTFLYTLAYFDTINYSAPNDFVQIDDITENGTINSIPPVTGPTTFAINRSFTFQYDPANGERLDSLFYQTGDVTFTTTSTINGDVAYTYTVENTVNTNSNVPISISGNIATPGGSETVNRSLLNHKTLLTDASGDNTFTVNVDLSITLGALQFTDGTETVSFDFTYGNQTFSLIYGKFGQDMVQVGDQSIDLDFFTQAAREGITFGNPSMTFEFRNSFGIPIGVDFSSLRGEDATGGNQTFLTGDIVNNPPVIEGSDVNSPGQNTPGETVQTIVEIDRTNSNIIQVLGSNPERLVFNVAGNSNPEDADALNYLQPTSEITAIVGVEVPLEVQLENLQETGTFGLGDGLDLENVDSAFLRVVTINELPFSATATLEIKDADSVTLHTVADNLIINAPFINVLGEVTDPNGSTTDIPLSSEGVDALLNASFVQITLTLNTPESQTSREIYVRIQSNYSLTVRVGVGGKFNLEL